MSAGIHCVFFSWMFLNTSAMSTGGSSRGDLGFIPNVRYPNPNRNFYGSPGNLSKKGVALFSQTAKINNTEKTPELTTESIVGKRTEYLETQGRRISATINEHKSEQQRLAEQLAVSVTNIEDLQTATARVGSEQENLTRRTKLLAQEQHWVYGKTSRVLKGICGKDNTMASISEYRAQTVERRLMDLAEVHEWVLLSYPMERAETETGFQYLMKMKTVQPRTGQISVHWAIVFEEVNGVQHFAIEKFSVCPH